MIGSLLFAEDDLITLRFFIKNPWSILISCTIYFSWSRQANRAGTWRAIHNRPYIRIEFAAVSAGALASREEHQLTLYVVGAIINRPPVSILSVSFFGIAACFYDDAETFSI